MTRRGHAWVTLGHVESRCVTLSHAASRGVTLRYVEASWVAPSFAVWHEHVAVSLLPEAVQELPFLAAPRKSFVEDCCGRGPTPVETATSRTHNRTAG